MKQLIIAGREFTPGYSLDTGKFNSTELWKNLYLHRVLKW